MGGEGGAGGGEVLKFCHQHNKELRRHHHHCNHRDHGQVKDVRVPEQLQRAMAAEAEAAREARAKVRRDQKGR